MGGGAIGLVSRLAVSNDLPGNQAYLLPAVTLTPPTSCPAARTFQTSITEGQSMPKYQINYGRAEFEDSIKRNRSWPKLYAKGDSWFAYPLASRNIITWLAYHKRCSLLSRSKSGHTAEMLMGVRQRKTLVNDFKRWDFDAILFSAGGNDIAGDALGPLLRDWKPGMKAVDVIRQDRLAGKIGLIIQAFEDLVEIRNEYQPGVPIIAHEYDLAYPDGRPAMKSLGPLKKGPWLKPSLDARGIPEGQQRSVITWILREFGKGVRALESKGFMVVRTQGALKTHDLWANELHPNKEGFKIIAEKYRRILHRMLPDTF